MSGESNPSIGDIRGFRDDRHPGGIQTFHFIPHPMEQNVNVVDHQIMHHTDVRAARSIGRQTVSFNKQRRNTNISQRCNRWIESLDMSHLENQLPLSRALDQFPSFLGSRC